MKKVATIQERLSKMKQDSFAMAQPRAGQSGPTVQERLGRMKQDAAGQMAETAGVERPLLTATQSAAGGRTADEVWESMNGGQETASAQNMAAYKQEVVRKIQQGLLGEEINDWLMEQPMTEEQREELRKLAVDQLHR